MKPSADKAEEPDAKPGSTLNAIDDLKSLPLSEV